MRNKTLLALILVLLPVFSVTASVIWLVRVHENIKNDEAVYRAEEVAQYEMKRLVSMMNLRLNFLREELYHLTIEMPQEVTDEFKQKILFSRRDYLHSYAILSGLATPSGLSTPGGSEVLRYQYRVGGIPNFGFQTVDEMLAFYKTEAQKVSVTNYLFKPVNGNFEWFFVALPMKEEGGKDLVFAGIFNRAYVFTFCKGFNDAFGKINTNVMVVSDSGQVLCHSHERFEKQNITNQEFFKQIQGSTTMSARYFNIAAQAVVASIKKFNAKENPKENNSGIFFITEAYNMPPWILPVPAKELSIVLISVTVVTLFCVVMIAYLTGGFSEGLLFWSGTKTQTPETQTSEMNEIKRLQCLVAKLNASKKVAATFCRLAPQVLSAKELISLFLETLSSGLATPGDMATPSDSAPPGDNKYKIALYLYDEQSRRLQGITSTANWNPELIRSSSFDFETSGGKFKEYDKVVALLGPKLKEDFLRVEPIELVGKLVGVLAIAGENMEDPALVDRNLILTLIQAFVSSYMALRLKGA